MNLYASGLSAGAIVVPERARYTLDQLGRISSGFRNLRHGESRFYNRGLDRASVGAVTPPLGGVVDKLVGLILDIAHVMLVLGGMYLLWQGIHGGF